MSNQSSTDQLVATLAQQLGETGAVAQAQLRRVVALLGPDAAREILRETQRIEAGGGMLIATGKRRHTPGGVFFRLVRERAPRELRRQIFPKPKRKKARAPRRVRALPPDALPEVIQVLSAEYGPASTAKITLNGRPAQPVQRGEVVLVGLSGAPPTLPKGLPAPPATKYLVLIARKQWAKVAQAVQDAEDRLIVEGYPAYDARHAGITVFAINVTTRTLQAARRQDGMPPGAAG